MQLLKDTVHPEQHRVTILAEFAIGDGVVLSDLVWREVAQRDYKDTQLLVKVVQVGGEATTSTSSSVTASLSSFQKRTKER